MKNYKQNLKRGVIHLGQAGLVFGAAALVMGYLLGYYDISFIDRSELFGSDYQPSPVSVRAEDDFSSDMPSIPENSLYGDEDGAADYAAVEDLSGSGSGSGSSDGEGDAGEVIVNLRRVYDVSRLPDELSEIPLCSELLSEGFDYVGEYGDESALGKMVFSFKLPESAHYSRRIYKQQIVITPEDDGDPYLYVKDTAEYRPAVELYMGYILVDSGDDVIIVSGDGVPLSRFEYGRYAAAYARDSEGRPLFSREVDGVTRYYALSEDGKKFIQSDYNPDVDYVGLSFDYPEGWFDSDSTSVKVVSNLPESDEKDGDGTDDSDPVSANASLSEEILFGYVTPTGKLTEVKYAHAYAFRENRGVAVSASGRGELIIIDENGREAFSTTETYMNEHGRYETVYYMPPITTGIESMGHLYYDNGLLRVRRQVIDYYNYTVRRIVTVDSEEDVLLRTDGTEYSLPAGYELEGYSEGCIILKGSGYGGKYGVMTVEGSWIVQPIFDSISPYVGGLSVAGFDDGSGMRYGLIDRNGGIVLPFTYDRIQTCSGGLVCAYREENGWSVFKVMG